MKIWRVCYLILGMGSLALLGTFTFLRIFEAGWSFAASCMWSGILMAILVPSLAEFGDKHE